MANEFRRGYTPYEEPEDEDGLFTKIGRMLKGSRKYRTTPGMREVDFSGMSARDRAAKARKRERETPLRMGSRKNADEGMGRGTVPMPELTPAPRQSPMTQPAPAKTFKQQPVDIPVSPMMPTAGIAGLEGTPSGPALNRMEEPAMPAPIEDRSMPAPRMRRGLFGEEIPEEVYQEMERKNKEAGFYGRFKKGGSVKKKTKKYSSGGSVSSASKRADGICQKGKTKGRMV